MSDLLNTHFVLYMFILFICHCYTVIQGRSQAGQDLGLGG